MNSDEILVQLSGSRINFHVGVAEFGRSDLPSSQRMELCVEMVGRLPSTSIGDTERSERYLRILTEAKLEAPELRALAGALVSASASIKNAASQVLPDSL